MQNLLSQSGVKLEHNGVMKSSESTASVAEFQTLPLEIAANNGGGHMPSVFGSALSTFSDHQQQQQLEHLPYGRQSFYYGCGGGNLPVSSSMTSTTPADVALYSQYVETAGTSPTSGRLISTTNPCVIDGYIPCPSEYKSMMSLASPMSASGVDAAAGPSLFQTPVTDIGNHRRCSPETATALLTSSSDYYGRISGSDGGVNEFASVTGSPPTSPSFDGVMPLNGDPLHVSTSFLDASSSVVGHGLDTISGGYLSRDDIFFTSSRCYQQTLPSAMSTNFPGSDFDSMMLKSKPAATVVDD